MKFTKQSLTLVTLALCYSAFARPDIAGDRRIIMQILAKDTPDWTTDDSTNLRAAKDRLQTAGILGEMQNLALTRLANEVTGGPGTRTQAILTQGQDAFENRFNQWEVDLREMAPGLPASKWQNFFDNPMDPQYAIDMNFYAQSMLDQEAELNRHIKFSRDQNVIDQVEADRLIARKDEVKNLIFKRQVEYANRLLDIAKGTLETGIIFVAPNSLNSPDAIKTKIEELGYVFELTERVRSQAKVLKADGSFVDHLLQTPEAMALQPQFLTKKEALFVTWNDVITNTIIGGVLRANDAGKASIYGAAADRDDIWNIRDELVIDLGKTFLTVLDQYAENFHITAANGQNVETVIIPGINAQLNVQRDNLNFNINQPKQDINFAYQKAVESLNELAAAVTQAENLAAQQNLAPRIDNLNLLLTAGDPAQNIIAYKDRDDRSRIEMENMRDKLQDATFMGSYMQIITNMDPTWAVVPTRDIQGIIDDLDAEIAVMMAPPPPGAPAPPLPLPPVLP